MYRENEGKTQKSTDSIQIYGRPAISWRRLEHISLVISCVNNCQINKIKFKYRIRDDDNDNKKKYNNTIYDEKIDKKMWSC